jgi:hypothetical protein
MSRVTLTDTDRQPLPRWALVADTIAAVFLVVGVAILATGGGVFWIGNLRISAHSASRPLVIGFVIGAIRYWFVRQPFPLVTRVIESLRRRAEAEEPLPFEEHRLFAATRIGFSSRAGELLVLTAAYSVLVAIATWPQVVEPHAVSDMGDPIFSIWRLMWIFHEFPRDPLNIFNGNQFYPEPRTLSFSDPVLAVSLLFAPLYGLGLDRIVAYNIVFLSGGVLSGVTTFLLVRALTGRADAAWVSGAIFAVYPYRVEHFAHLELQMSMGVPIALWGLHRTMASGRVRDGLATGLAVAAQFYSALYYGAFLMTYSVVVGGVLWLARGRPRAPLRALAAGALLAAVLFSPVAAVYLKTRSYMGNRHRGEVEYYSAVGGDYAKAHYRSYTYYGMSDGAEPERSLFPRFTPLVLAGLALWPPLSVSRIAYALALAFSVEASLGLNGSVFPWLYDYVPPYGGIRVPARYSLMVGLSLAILSGYGAARAFRRWPRLRGPLLALMLAAIAVEALPRLDLVHPWREPPPIYGTLAGRPHPVVLAEFPMPAPGVYEFSEFVYVYFSSFHWSRLVNGQSGWLPPTYWELIDKTKTFPSDEAMDYLRRRGVEYITVHGAFYPAGAREAWLAAVEAREDLVLVSEARWEGSRSRLYRLR